MAKGKRNIFDTTGTISDTLGNTPSDFTSYGDKTNPEHVQNNARIHQTNWDLVSNTAKQFGANLASSFGQGLANTFDLVSNYNTAKSMLTGSDTDFTASLFGVSTLDMQNWANNVANNNKIYEKNEGGFDMSDPGWWAKQLASSGTGVGMGLEALGETAAIEFATEGTGTGVAVARLGSLAKRIKTLLGGAKTIEEAANIARSLRSTATIYGVLNRLNESKMEAANSYQQIYGELDKEKNQDGTDKYSKDELAHLSSEGAKRDYLYNLALIPLDILSYRTMVFNPISGTGEGLIEKGLEKVAGVFGESKLGKAAGWLTTHAVGSQIEGLEEGFQQFGQNEGDHYAKVLGGINDGKSFSDRLGDTVESDDFWNNYAGGVIGAPIIGGAMNLINKTLKGRQQSRLAELHKNYVQNIARMDNNLATKITDLEKNNQGDLAAQKRKQFNALQTLTGVHLDAQSDKTTAYDSRLTFLQGALGELNSGKTDFLKDLGFNTDNIKPEHLAKIKEEFEGYVKDTQKIKSIYDNLKNSYNKNILPAVTYQNFQLNKLGEVAQETEANVVKSKANLLNYNNYSDYGKQLFDHNNNIRVIQEDNKRLKGLLNITEDEFDKRNIKEVIDNNEGRISKINEKIGDINNNSSYEQEDRNKDRDINESSVIDRTHLQNLYDREYVNNEMSLQRKQLSQWGKKDYRSVQVKNNIKNAQTTEQLDNIQQELNKNKATKNNNNNKTAPVDNNNNDTELQKAVDDKKNELKAKEAAQNVVKPAVQVHGKDSLFTDEEFGDVNDLVDASTILPKTNNNTIPSLDYEKLDNNSKEQFIKNSSLINRDAFKSQKEFIDYFEAKRRDIKEYVNSGDKEGALRADNYVDNYINKVKENGTLDAEYEKLKDKYNLNENKETTEDKSKPVVFYGNTPEWQFSPVVYDFNNSPEDAKLKIKTSVGKMLDRLGANPSFEDLARYVLKIKGESDTDKIWNTLIYGWEANDKNKVDYDAVYANIFGNPFDELDMALSQLITPAQIAQENAETGITEVIKEEKPVTFDSTNQPVYNYGDTRVTNESLSKFAFSNLPSSMIANDNGDSIDISYNQVASELVVGTDIDSRELLDIHNFLPNTEISIKVPDNFLDIRIPVFSANMVIKTIPFGQYVSENKLTADSQEYKDKIPMIISKKGESKGVAFVHDVEWYNPTKFNQNNPEDMKAAIANTRAIRQEVIDNKGKTEGIVTGKRQTTFGSLKTKQNENGNYDLISLKEANPQTRLGIGDSNGTITIAKGVTYPNNGGKLKNDKPILANRVYEVREFGMEDGKITYMAFPVIREKLDEQTKESIKQVIKAYATKTTQSSILIKNEISKVMGIDIFSPMGLEQYLSHFIYLSNPLKLPRKEGTPYIATEKGSIIIGQAGIKQSTTKEKYVIDPRNVGTIKDLEGLDKSVIVDGKVYNTILDWFEHNLNLNGLSKNKDVVHIDKDDKTTSNGTYNDYLLNNYKTNIRSFNIGTEDKPNYVTNVQPIITYDTKKRLSQQQVQETEEVKPEVAEVKPEIKADTTKEDLKAKLLANVRKNLGNSTGEGKLNFSPLLTDEQTDSIGSSIVRIGGLTFSQQDDIVNFMYNQMIPIIDTNGGTITEKEVNKQVGEIFKKFIKPHRDETSELLGQLKSIDDGTDNDIKEAITDLEYKIGKIKAVENNFNALKKLAFDRVFKNTNIKLDKSTEEENAPDTNNNGRDNDDNQEEDLSQNQRDFSTNVLTENPNKKVTYAVRRLLGQIRKYDKEGNPVTGFMNMIPVYMSSDDILRTLRTTLVDTPADFDVMMDRLEQRKDGIPYMQAVIDKLKASNNQTKNQFVTALSMTSLKMKFAMIAYDRRSGNYNNKLFDTNLNGISDAIRNQWNNNLLGISNLTKLENGNIVMDNEVANDLIDKFKSWKGYNLQKLDFDMSSYWKNVISKVGKGSQVFSAEGGLLKELNTKLVNNTDKVIFNSKGHTYQINKIGDKFRVKLLDKVEASKEEVSKWLTSFGINLNTKTMDELFNNGLKHNKSEIRWNGLFEDGLNTNGLFGILYNELVNRVEKGSTFFDEEGNSILSNSVIKSLANLESNYNETITPFGFRDNGKSFYAITTPKYVTDRVVDLKRGGDILRQLSSVSFSQPSLWLTLLKDENFRDLFNIANVGDTAIKQRGKNVYKDSSITKLSSLDHEAVKLTAFQDTTQGKITYVSGDNSFDVYPDTSIKLRVGTMFSPTMSDKDQMTMITTAVLDLKNRDLGDGKSISDEVCKALYEQIVKPELQRIISFSSISKANGDKGTNISGYDKGAGMFLLMPNINNVEYATGLKLIDAIKHEPQTFNIQEFEGNKDLKNSLFSKIREYVDNLTKDKLAEWGRLGIVSRDENGLAVTKFIDNKYFNDNGKFYGSNAEKVKMAAMDYVVNSLISNANSFMTMIGDPAFYFKEGKRMDENGDARENTVIEKAQDTFDNIGKRLANQIAPGGKLANSENEKYLQLFLLDREVASKSLPYLEEILGKEEAAKFKKNDASDAQEYTTWKEHLDILTRLGQTSDNISDISAEEIQEAREIFASGVDKNSLTEKQLALIKKVAQPIKPVYTGQIYDKVNDAMRVVYIKSSSFPLIPQLTKGFEIDKLRTKMESIQDTKKMNVRASYQTANKVGSVNVAKDEVLWNDEDNIDDKILNNLEKNSLILDRKNFRIQQEVPFKSGKNSEDTITLGTQLMKLLFGDDIMDYDGYNYKGKSYKGSELHTLYNDAFNKLVQEKQSQLFNELGLDNKGVPINEAETTKKLQSLLEKEAISRNYPLQDIIGLKMDTDGNFNLPIWSSISSDRYEAMLNAIVGNRMLRMKFPGNSYIVGSERGFKTNIKEEQDLSNVDKSKVIFTSAWNGKELQYTRKENGQLKHAQVFVASKFRDNEGNIVDLFTKKDGKYVYINETASGYQLNAEMLDPELLQLISFRIPTSGHQSAAVIEIAGFLPYTSGDLMIVPKEFTKQKGLDFDVDKENTYQLWHRMDKDGRFKVLDESHRNDILTEADSELKKIHDGTGADDKLLNAIFGSELDYNTEDIEGDKKLTKVNSRVNEKLLHNDIIRMTKAVLSNPKNEVQAKIHKTLNTDYAEEEATFVDNLINSSKDNTTWTGLSDSYQKNKLISGANGKLGTGAYSLDVVFHSLAQQSKKTGNPINLTFITTDEDGKPIKQTKVWKFGDNTYVGQLGNSLTVDGDRSVAEVLGERQNIAVDNEKLQIMGKVGLNDLTLDVDKVMNLIGIDKGEDGHSISFLFLSQPIIREYVEEMKNANSNLAEYTKNKEQGIIDKLIQKYDPSPRELSDRYEDMMGEKMSNENMIAAISDKVPDGELQHAILRRFLDFKTYGEQLRGVQSAINFSQNSLGKSFFDVISKKNKLNKLGFGNQFVSNIDKLIGDYVSTPIDESDYNNLEKEGYVDIGTFMVKPTSIMGSFNIHTVSTAFNLWSRYFPFDTNITRNVFNEISSILTTEDKADTTRDVENKQKAFKHMKKFFAAASTSGIIDGNLDINNERQRLFIDNNDNTSLAKYMNRLVNISGNPTVDTFIKSNRLINRFEYQVAKIEGEPSKIIYNNAGGEELDEQYLYEALTTLLTQRDASGNRIELPKIGNKEYTLDTLAQDLIRYCYLGNSTQEAVQFTKYVPISYLDTIGYNKHMKDVNFWLNNGIIAFKSETNWHMVSKVTMQYFQHNPDEVGYKRNAKNIFSDITENNSKKLDDLTEFKLKNEDKPVFISVRNPNEKNKYKTNSGFQLYWFDGDKYKRIPVLGAFGMDEYQPKNYIGTSILNDSKINVEPTSDILGNSGTNDTDDREDRFNISTGNVAKSLDSIAKSGIEYYSELAKQLSPFIGDKLKIGWGEQAGDITAFNGIYNWNTNDITIHSTNTKKLTDRQLAETVLEEVIHGITINQINQYITVGTNNVVVTKLNAPRYVTDIVQLYNDVRNATDTKRIDEVMRKVRNNQGLANNDKILYGLGDIYEFIARSLTDKDFQGFLAQDKFKVSTQTRLEKFKDFIFNVLKSLGIKFDNNTATVQAINSIFEFIKETSSDNTQEISKQNEDMWKAVNEESFYDEPMSQEDLDKFNNLFDGDTVEESLSPTNYPDKTFDFKEEKCL